MHPTAPSSRIPLRIRIAAALCLALLAPGCPNMKTVHTTPTVLVPSIESEPKLMPAPESAPTGAIAPQAEIPPELPEQTPQKPQPKRKKVAHKAAPAAPAAAEAAKPETPKAEPETPRQEPAKAEPAKAEPPKPETPKTPAVEGSAPITAAVPRGQAQSQTYNTEQMLRDSESKLASLGRALNESEQAMRSQARDYIVQGRQAMQAGDLERAYNLAMKANLLANELAK